MQIFVAKLEKYMVSVFCEEKMLKIIISSTLLLSRILLCKTLPKALRTQVLTALTINFGLEGLVWQVWFCRFGLVGLVWQVWFGRFGLVCLVW